MHRTSSDRQIVLLNCLAMAQHGIILLLVGPIVPNLMTTFGIRESMAGLLLVLLVVTFNLAVRSPRILVASSNDC